MLYIIAVRLSTSRYKKVQNIFCHVIRNPF